MGITAKELAEILGVSRSTISMVYNNKDGISEETRNAVLHAAKQYGYEFTKKKKVYVSPTIIQYIVFMKHGNVVSDTDFFSHVLLGIDHEIKRLGYSLQISYFYGTDTEEVKKQLEAIKYVQPDGLILLATEMNREDINCFKALKLPLVILDNYTDTDRSDCITISNVQGAYNATHYLIQMGHTSIGHLSSKIRIKNFDERAEGFEAAVRSASAENDIRSCDIPVGSTSESAYCDMCDYLDQKPELPSAFFADNDIIASSCMKALKDHGFSIPDPISVIGFDDMPFCDMLDPPLSTMRVSKEALGKAAVALLDRQLYKKPENHIKIEISTELVERNSVKRLANKSPQGRIL